MTADGSDRRDRSEPARRADRSRARRSRRTQPAVASTFRPDEQVAARRRADELDDEVGGRIPAVLRRGAGRPRHRRRRQRVRRLLPWRHGCDGRPCAGADGGCVERQIRRGDDDDAPRPRTRPGWGRSFSARFGLAALAVRADGDRRQPLGAPILAGDHRSSEGARLQLLLPRLVDETFVDLENGRPRSREGNVGPMVDPDRDDQGRGVQRPRRARRGARPRRCRLRARRAGAHEHRHRPARARLPRGLRELTRGRARCS